jgi:hypothetical protein
VQWLVNAVRHSNGDGRLARIVILIGNLEETHYSEASEPGETQQSINKLLEWLQPAIAARFVDIRQFTFTQDDVTPLMRTLAP